MRWFNWRIWTASAQLARSVDDSTIGGRTTSRFRSTRDQATWQNALQLGTDHRLVLAYEHVRERVDAELLGSIGMRRRDDAPGTEVHIRIPLRGRT